MTKLINNLKKTFEMYLEANDIILSQKQIKIKDDTFSKIMNEFVIKSQWSAPELVTRRALNAIYKFILCMEDEFLKEHLRVFWNRWSARFYFKQEFEYSKMDDPVKFYEKYSMERLKNKYDDHENMYNYLKLKINEIGKYNQYLKPLIVRLIEDNDYFITQKNYKLYLIRTNDGITSHPNTNFFNKVCIDFYDKTKDCICHKGLIYALM